MRALLAFPLSMAVTLRENFRTVGSRAVTKAAALWSSSQFIAFLLLMRRVSVYSCLRCAPATVYSTNTFADTRVGSETSRMVLRKRPNRSTAASFPGARLEGARACLGLSMYCLTRRLTRMSRASSFSQLCRTAVPTGLVL